MLFSVPIPGPCNPDLARASPFCKPCSLIIPHPLNSVCHSGNRWTVTGERERENINMSVVVAVVVVAAAVVVGESF